MTIRVTAKMIKVRVDDHSGTIVMDRPARRNALSRSMLQELQQAFNDLHQEKKVRAVILTGAAECFCAGMDLHEMFATSQDDLSSQQQWHADAMAYRSLLEQMLRFPKPIIAAMNGPALGGGAGLACASDIVIAARTASIGIPATKRGLVAGMVVPLIVFRIGAGPAANLVLTGKTIDAAEALRLNLFHELTDDDKVWARAHQISGECALGAAEAIGLTKRMLNEHIGEQVMTLLTTGAAVTATSKTTEAAREGMAAFVNKREPNWP